MKEQLLMRTIDSFLMAVLDLSDGDVVKLREVEVMAWDAQNAEFIPSNLPLHKLLRLVIENVVQLDKHRCDD